VLFGSSVTDPLRYADSAAACTAEKRENFEHRALKEFVQELAFGFSEGKGKLRGSVYVNLRGSVSLNLLLNLNPSGIRAAPRRWFKFKFTSKFKYTLARCGTRHA
jgi:hypothetical protein